MSDQAVQESDAHKNTVREEFTRQADAYAVAPVITDAARIARLVNAINPGPDSRALEVATGPGHVAMALAARCREVIGIDLTPAPIAIAERTRRERGILNVRFQVAEADRLSFADGEFDLAVCRFAFHHFEHPAAIMAEMARVTRRGGVVAVEDLYASEIAERADYANHVERLRDSSHTKALSLSELIAMIGREQLDIERINSDRIESDMENWLATTQTQISVADEVRRLVADDMRDDVSGMCPFVRDGKVHIVQRTTAIITRKL